MKVKNSIAYSVTDKLLTYNCQTVIELVKFEERLEDIKLLNYIQEMVGI